MLKKVTLIISTDIEEIENASLEEIFNEDVIDYDVENLTTEEQEIYE